MLKEELKHIKESKKDLRKFGLTVGLVLVIIAALLFYFEKSSAVYFALIGAILILTSFIYPRILKPLNKVWMGLAIVLGFIMSRIILTILFYLVLTPIALLAKLLGKKFMELKYDKTSETYWEKRKIKEKNKLDYERQF
jgi:multisubunit Na+/H+ antiporter MnhG subunit